jgi:hypothetical protein
VRVGRFERSEIVVVGAVEWRVGVLADVDAKDAAPAGPCQIDEQPLHATVVEAEPVDQGAMLRQAEDARARVARLRAWRHRADFDKAEAQRRQAIDVRAIFVETGGQTDAVGKFHAQQLEATARCGLRVAHHGADQVDAA